MWTIKYLKSARKDVQKIDPQIRKRVREYLEQRIARLENPRQLGEPLKGQLTKLWRYRVGDYRIVCELRDHELIVVRIGHRKNVYKNYDLEL
ncbi:addiction module toxin, RelE/StbE family [Desulfonatronospira thiodismutans ASO3-1]|uniref:Addiction module toxin, RelE/StbE family n=1 Tax=Desulfonatronospira thiodismutans ASO3-1 TaxID=555779 RepID=D6SRX4_9BACT|nr:MULTISPECIES: type II toxin-antitoxin system RelE/ParE family toxin [Desulfonatronospira]EFI33440.1 addiction module toxin, RelE/StbE family [Desulfonatronospira thiodismutans ASO3-1]RQD77781.1 MAG: type II toxin-antitoxin system RelE/ParE family toxin [Desulfonatronospira sp. MSAO_Bac3]